MSPEFVLPKLSPGARALAGDGGSSGARAAQAWEGPGTAGLSHAHVGFVASP